MLKDVPDVLTVKEAATVLRCGRTKLLQYIHEGRIDAYKVAGKWVVFKEDVVEYIMRN